jgi:hypothetical protein
MTEVRVKFKTPAKLGQDAALALEDYARAASTFDAAVVLDREHHVTAVSLAAGNTPVSEAVAQDIERFFDSLVSDSADRLGWR